MQQSNTYILSFTVGMTVICAVLLAGVFEALKPLHLKNEEIDIKKSILSAYMDVSSVEDIQAEYDKNIVGIVLDAQGNPVTKDADGNDLLADKIKVRKQYKEKDASKKLFPVFQFKGEKEGEFAAYIIPVYGNGLWDEIWGFIAIEQDFNTIAGASFDHKGETPGLGAEITQQWFKDSFKGKQLFDGKGELKSITVLKGSGNASIDAHQVDGIAGASMTTGGVNKMLKSYFNAYKAYFARMSK